MVEGRKAVVRYMSTVSGTRAGDPEPQTMNLNPKSEAVGPSEDYSVMAWKGTLFLTHLPALTEGLATPSMQCPHPSAGMGGRRRLFAGAVLGGQFSQSKE